VRSHSEACRYVVVGAPMAHGDGWPPALDRSIAAWAPDERAALALCTRTDLATVAYDAIASSYDLVRRETPAVPSRTIYVVQRRAVGTHRRTEALVAAIHEAMEREPV